MPSGLELLVSFRLPLCRVLQPLSANLLLCVKAILPQTLPSHSGKKRNMLTSHNNLLGAPAGIQQMLVPQQQPKGCICVLHTPNEHCVFKTICLEDRKDANLTSSLPSQGSPWLPKGSPITSPLLPSASSCCKILLLVARQPAQICRECLEYWLPF